MDVFEALNRASGIRAGDKVKLIRTAKDWEMRWPCVWPDSANDWVGRIGTVADNTHLYGGSSIRVDFRGDGSWAAFPFFVLEKVEDAPEPEPEFVPWMVKVDTNPDDIDWPFDWYKVTDPDVAQAIKHILDNSEGVENL